MRKPIPLLLLLASPCFVLGSSEKPTNEEILALNRARPNKQAAGAQVDKVTSSNNVLLGDAPSTSAKGPSSTRYYVGTEDAPVDGLDGKPHAGPFVDTTPEKTEAAKDSVSVSSSAKALPTILEKLAGGASSEDGWKLADIPEKNDGVMNDAGRQIPKKGTTGTEGGVSEKDKAKLAKGGNEEKKPQAPSEARPLPHSEEERIEASDQKPKVKGTQDTIKKEIKSEEKSGKQSEPAKKGGEYGAGGLNMQKPTDLPETPHSAPHPESKIPTDGSSRDSSGSSWLQETLPYTEGQKPKSSKPIAPGSLEPHDENVENWFHSFFVSFTMIIFTEIGDKTFLVAALMAMRHDRLVVFTGALSALITMTILSAVLGHIAPTLLPKRLTTLAAAILFLVFGGRMLREGLDMPSEAGVGEEMREVEAELEEKEHTLARRSSRKDSNPYILEAGRGKGSPSPSRSPSSSQSRGSGLTNLLSLVLSPIWVQTFVMTFLGEWGDRSQIATIAMAAGQDYWWVTLGGIAGHACCTGLAVVGGRALAGKVSMRVVTIGGAGAFLVFGLLYLYEAYIES